MSGQRIDDHSFWAGGRSEGSVFPNGAKVKTMSQGDGCGEVSKYADTSEAVKSLQDMNESKARGHAAKFNHRN